MTEPPTENIPRWIRKREKVAKTDQELRVMFKVGGVIFVGIAIWTIANALMH